MSDAFPCCVVVVDAVRRLLGTFDDAETAHRFAHEVCRGPDAQPPVEVFDLSDRSSRFVWPDRCKTVRWLAVGRPVSCGVSPACRRCPSPLLLWWASGEWPSQRRGGGTHRDGPRNAAGVLRRSATAPSGSASSGGAVGVEGAAQSAAEQVRHAVDVALGWAEDAGRDLVARLAEMPVLPAEREMLAAKLGAAAADLRLVRDRMARVVARAGHRAGFGEQAGGGGDRDAGRPGGEPARCSA